MMLWYSLAMGAILGYICAVQAPKRGRSSKVWFWVGLFFGWIGLIALFLLPKKIVVAEPIVADLKDDKEAKPCCCPISGWYYLNEHKTPCGPISLVELRSIIIDRGIEMWIWHPTLQGWQKVKETPALMLYIQ